LVGVQRCEQARAAGTENENVSFYGFHLIRLNRR
jgi:hypothetical protein